MSTWVDEAIFYHIYPLGFCGAPLINFGEAPENRIEKVIEWIPHLKDMKINAVYFGPVFESTVHGYDTNDYRKLDSRLGDNESFRKVCDKLHDEGIRVILDGVFNHVGRDFWAFIDLRENLQGSAYINWFHNINFGQTSSYGDAFSYEGWQGHYDLVKLNLRNPEVVDYLFGSIRMWINEFGIDGLRLDAADCVDFEFFKQLRSFTKGIKPDFWLMGEIIHGDYNRWANPEMLDSVTNYECQKGIYSSHNDKNYFEIAYSLNRQFGTDALYKSLNLYTFVDNHDVNRLATSLKRPEYIYNAYTIMYAMPGIPSIYYGSEWGIKGERSSTSDIVLRPCLNLGKIENPNENLLAHIKTLGKLYGELPALQFGSYEQVIVKNEQLVFKRISAEQTVYAAFNLAEREETVTFRIKGTFLCDKLNGNNIYTAQNNIINLKIPAFSSMLLTEENEIKSSPKTEKQGVIVGGKYRHFKGGEYVVVEIGRHSETLEEMVVYKELNGQNHVWIRPLVMFTGEVNDFGNIKKRFELMD